MFTNELLLFAFSQLGKGPITRGRNIVKIVQQQVHTYIYLMYVLFVDIDSNGYLDERDFACLALRATIIEGKGEFSHSRLQEYQHIMMSLWEEIAELADFNKVTD